MMPKPIRTLVMMAGVEWKWLNVYRIIPKSDLIYGMNELMNDYSLTLPVRKMGIEMKKPPTAQMRLVLDFSK